MFPAPGASVGRGDMPFIAMSPAFGVGVAPIQGMARATGRSRKAFMNAHRGVEAIAANFGDGKLWREPSWIGRMTY